MNEMKWVPGVIWVTPRGQDVHSVENGKNVWRYVPRPPMLVAVSQITDVCATKPSDSKDTANTCVSMSAGSESFVQVTETVEEIAELIRLEWEGRVSLQAEIRRAVESGETE